jgi:AraC-like DNA-binding protein
MTRRDRFMSFHFFSPGPAVSRFVRAYWLDQHEPHSSPPSLGLPSGNAQIVIDLSGHGLRIPEVYITGSAPTVAGALFNGPDTKHFLVRYDDGAYSAHYMDADFKPVGSYPAHYMGADFKPGGAYPFVGPPAGELCDAHLPLETLWGRYAVDELRERLMRARAPAERCQILEAALLAQLARPLERHPAVTLALRAFAAAPRGPVITQVADQLALSHTRFIELFRDEVGLRPKQFYRVRRFVRMLQHTRNEERPNWAQLARDFGYFDQAHLCRDFHQFAGVSPTAYLRDRHPFHPTFLVPPNGDTAAEETLTALIW